jgi:Ca-activated chloride channel family protein
MRFDGACARTKGIAAMAAALVLFAAPIFFTYARAAHGQTKPASRRTNTSKNTNARTNKNARTNTNTRAASRTAQTKPTPAPPVRVPQLSPAQPRTTTTTTSAQPTTRQTSQQSAQTIAQQTPTPRPLPTQTPAATPTPKPADAIEDDEIITVTSNLVVVPVAVTDARGEPVQGLKAADFQLEEEGRAQTVAQVGDAEQVPLDIAILFDVSSSVSQKNFFEFQQRAAASFLKQVLKPTDRAAVITITREPQLVQPLASAEQATAKLVAIPAATIAEPTAFYDTVSFAAKYLNDNAPGRHRRVILVISDGDDNFSNAVREQTVAEYEAEKKAEAASGNPQAVRAAARRDLQARHQRAVAAVQREVQRADAVFYSINPGGPSVRLNEIASRAQANMQQLAESTGGTAYVPARAEDLETVFRQIASELRAQYLLQYYSNNDAPAGKFLSIKVRVPARTELKVRARQGYYSKKG